MTDQRTPSERITEEVTSWLGVEAGPGRRGEFAFRLGGREIGHLHGDHAAHFMFPKQLWDELRSQGRIVPHPIFPDSRGPAARRIEDDADIEDVIELMRLNYDRAVARHGLPAGAGAQAGGARSGVGKGVPAPVSTENHRRLNRLSRAAVSRVKAQ